MAAISQSASGTRNDILRQIAVVAGFVGVLVGNSLSEAIPINGQTSAQISNRLPILITPANYAFAIWGAIWLGLGAFAVYQALPAQRTNPYLRKIAPWFLLSCLCNVVWLVLFHFNQFPLSCVVIALLEVSLIVIYLQQGIGRRAVSTVERWCTQIPFSLYLGWVTVATIVNIAYTLYDAGYRPDIGTQELWTVLLLGVAFVIGCVFAVRHKEIALIGVQVWAFVAIASARVDSPMVRTAALTLAAFLVIVVLFAQITGTRTNRPIVTGRRALQ